MSSPADSRAPLALDIRLVRQLFAQAPEQLPRIFVHRNSVWVTAGGALASAKIDNRGDLHMCEADMAVLKTMLPVREIGRIRTDVTEFRFDVPAHAMLAGDGDRRPVGAPAARKAELRAALGHERQGRRRKVKIFGRLH